MVSTIHDPIEVDSKEKILTRRLIDGFLTINKLGLNAFKFVLPPIDNQADSRFSLL